MMDSSSDTDIFLPIEAVERLEGMLDAYADAVAASDALLGGDAPLEAWEDAEERARRLEVLIGSDLLIHASELIAAARFAAERMEVRDEHA